MAEGTRMKNLETQVQQCGSTMANLQARVEDQLELGSDRNHEVIVAVDRKLDVTVTQIQEELQGFMVMFTRKHQVSIPPNFPPQKRAKSICQGKAKWIQFHQGEKGIRGPLRLW